MNKTFHIGNLTRDPELKYSQSGKAIANFGLAVQDGKETIFLDFEAWEKTAELVAKYKKKGEPLGVEGRLKVASWTDKTTDQKRTKLVLVAEKVEFISGKGSENTSSQKTEDKQAKGAIQETQNEDDVPF